MYHLLQVSYGDEKFPPNDGGPVPATAIDGLVKEARDIAEVCVHLVIVVLLCSSDVTQSLRSCARRGTVTGNGFICMYY